MRLSSIRGNVASAEPLTATWGEGSKATGQREPAAADLPFDEGGEPCVSGLERRWLCAQVRKRDGLERIDWIGNCLLRLILANWSMRASVSQKGYQNCDLGNS